MAVNENMLPIGTLLRGGTYRVEKQLASGGFGNTYIVRNINFDETYAMKEFFMKGINSRDGDSVTVSVPDNKVTFENQKTKFKKEAQRLRKINNPYIVKVHDLFEENDTIYYVMDYIDGKSLSEIMKERGKPFSEKEAMYIFNQVLDALQDIHNQSPQMLHLDIKPSNLLQGRGGHVCLIDFGSSKQLDAEQGITVSSGITLTKGYAPSELEDGKKERIGAWTDFYELGATLYNLLTCHEPPMPSEILEESKEAFYFPPSISQSTKELILWMMDPNRKNRPQSVNEIKSNSRYHINEAILEFSDNEATTFAKKEENTSFDNNIEGKRLERGGKVSFKWVYIGILSFILIVSVGYFKYVSDVQRNEENAYKNAMQSSEPAVWRNYLDFYIDAPQTHRDSILYLLKQEK